MRCGGPGTAPGPRRVSPRDGSARRVAAAGDDSARSISAPPAASPEASAAEARSEWKGEKGFTPKLADYAAKLRYEDIPAPVRQRIKDCIADTVAVIVYGG